MKKSPHSKTVPPPGGMPYSGEEDVTPDFALTWECPNCGQTFFGKIPPDLCAYCQDFTTWRKRNHHHH